MKFNKIISVFLLPLLALFTSCEQGPEELARISTEKATYEVGKEGGDVVVKLLATQDWTATVSPASSLDDIEGITVEPSEGSASSDLVDVTLKVAANKSYNRAAIISFAGSTVSGAITLSQEGEEGERLLTCTVKEFLAKPVDASVYYVLEGEVTNSTNPDTYSNFTLLDPKSGASVLIYGLGYKEDPTNQNVGVLKAKGVEEGDRITIASTRGEYNGTIEGIKSYYISHKKSETPSIKLGSTEVTAAKGTAFDLAVTSNLVTWTLSSNVGWLSFDPATSDKSETVKVSVGEDGESNEGVITLAAEGLANVTCKVTRTDIVDATVEEFLAAEVSTKPYRLTGKIESIANETYGNLYLQDATGRVYIYGITDWSKLGLRQGDIITIVGNRARYDDAKAEDQKDEMKNASLEKSIKSTDVSVTEFLAKDVASTYLTSPYYRLTGVVKEVVNATYGNLYLKEESSDTYVYVYGLTASPVVKNDKSFGKLEVTAGDKVTLVGQRGQFSSAEVEDQKEEVVNAYFVSVEKGEAPENVLEVEPEAASSTATDTKAEITVTCTGDWTVTKEKGDWITSFTESGSGNGKIEVAFPANTTTENRSAEFTVTSGDLTASFTVEQKGVPETVYNNLSELNEAIIAAGKDGMDFKLNLTSAAEVTKVCSDDKTTYIQDATGAIMLYGATLLENGAEKTTIKGIVTGTGAVFNGLPEVTAIDFSKATIAQDGTGIYTEATIAEVLSDFNKYLNCKVKLTDVTVDDAFSQSDRNGKFSQGDSEIAIYVKNTSEKFSFTALTTGDVVCYPALYNTTKQVYFWGKDDFTVKAIGTEISLKSSYTVNVGETVSLAATSTSTATLKYVSADETIATVSEDGTVTGVKEGTVKITASVEAVEGYTAASATTTITVNPAGSTDPVVVYTLQAEKGTNSAYAGSANFEIDGITWNVTGNTQFEGYWRIGGKKLTDIDRAIYSKGAISEKIVKVVVTHGSGSAKAITVNSMSLMVFDTADDAASGDNAIATLPGTYAANGTTTFTAEETDDWTGKYYRIVYNLTNTTNDNKGIDFVKAEFYK